MVVVVVVVVAAAAAAVVVGVEAAAAVVVAYIHTVVNIYLSINQIIYSFIFYVFVHLFTHLSKYLFIHPLICLASFLKKKSKGTDPPGLGWKEANEGKLSMTLAY